ncbi:hypothetical protein [Terrabacter sp. RAF57]|uniref:hypothetical protein n=1 Tax=Terrabacter sp. RAF57 TaxID=3233063 RepID=UPI003F95BBE5
MKLPPPRTTHDGDARAPRALAQLLRALVEVLLTGQHEVDALALVPLLSWLPESSSKGNDVPTREVTKEHHALSPPGDP